MSEIRLARLRAADDVEAALPGFVEELLADETTLPISTPLAARLEDAGCSPLVARRVLEAVESIEGERFAAGERAARRSHGAFDDPLELGAALSADLRRG